MLRLHLLRHGESVNNASTTPIPDAPLTPCGRQQAEWVAAAWRGEHLDAVVCSPLWRALETAEPLVRARESPVHGWLELVEWNRSYPTQGRSPVDVGRRFPWVRFDPPLADVGWPAYPGSEREEQALVRATAVTERLAVAFPPSLVDGVPRVVLVGHQGFHGLLLRRWLHTGAVRFRLDNGHVHTLEVAGARVALIHANAPGYRAEGARGDPPSIPFRPEAGGVDVFLVRHAQSTANLTGARVYDPPLTGRGRAQADRLAGRLAAAGLDAVIASPMVRALETAVPIAAAAGAPIRVWPDLVEFNRWEAYGTLPAAEIAVRFPSVALEPGFPPDGARFNGPETPGGGWRRARMVVDRLRGGEAGRSVAVVAHGTFLGMVLAAALAVPPDAPVSFQRDNAAVDHLRWEGDVLTVCAVNAVEHLAGMD